MPPIRVQMARPIAVELSVPGDRSISHRALLLAALSNGPCELRGFVPSPECLAAVEACRGFGVPVEMSGGGDGGRGPVRLLVRGVGRGLVEPVDPIDCGSFATPLALLMGMAAGFPFRTRFLADSRVAEGVQPVVELLQSMGGRVLASGPVGARMYTVDGSRGLRAVRGPLPVLSSRVKGAGLFAGMSAGSGRTTLVEPVRTRDHTERMMQYFLVKTLRSGKEISIHGGQVPESRDFPIPGDISSAAVWIVAAAMQPGADLVVREVGLNESRTVFLRILVRMAAQIGESVKEWRFGEPWGHVTVHGMPLRAVRVTAEESKLVTDELPVLAAAAAVADGESCFAVEAGSVAARLMAAAAANLERMGVEVRHMGSAWHIMGNGFRGPLRGALLSAGGDHRLALGAAAAALVAEGESEIEHADVVEDVYPGFSAMLAKFQTREISMGIEPRVAFPRREIPVAGPGSGSSVPALRG